MLTFSSNSTEMVGEANGQRRKANGQHVISANQ